MSYSSTLPINRQRIEITYVREVLSEEVSIELVNIPAGEFLMGSPADEEGRMDREGPQHRVSVSEFWMGQYPITQAEWRIVASNYGKVNRELDPEPSGFKGDRRPVERVSWRDAVEFCERLSQHTGRYYRLPSEAEWEYACRATTATPFHFGATLSADYSNYDAREIYGPGQTGEYRKQTTPVDEFGVTNLFGLSDMHGNVWEWCQDNWHDTYAGAPTDGSAWLKQNESDNHFRIIRGGSWCFESWDCRSATRFDFDPDDRYFTIGFRVVLAPR